MDARHATAPASPRAHERRIGPRAGVARPLMLAVVLCAVVLLALPPWFGAMAEDAFRAQAEESPFSDYLEVRVLDYERGWYRSRATIALGLDSTYVELIRATVEADTGATDAEALEELEALAGDVGLRFVTEFAHGPVGFRRGPFLGMAKGVMHPEVSGGVTERWRQRLDVPYLLEIRHRIGFGGASRFELVVPPIDLQRDALRVTLRGTDVWVRYDPGSRRLSGRAALETFEVADDEADLQLESASADVDGTIAAPSLLLGSGGVRVERLSLVRPLERPDRTDMLGFRATMSTEPSDDGTILDTSFEYAVDSLRVGETGVSDAEVRMAALNVDRDAAERWAEFTRRAALVADSAGADSQAMEAELSGLIYDFLAADPALEVDPLRFRYGGDPLTARIRVTTETSTLPQRGEFDLLAPGSLGFWTRLFTVEAEIEAARRLARRLVAESQESALRTQLRRSGAQLPDEQIEAMAGQQADLLLGSLVEGGFLTQEGDRYVGRLRFEDGQLTANGQPLSLPGA